MNSSERYGEMAKDLAALQAENEQLRQQIASLTEALINTCNALTPAPLISVPAVPAQPFPINPSYPLPIITCGDSGVCSTTATYPPGQEPVLTNDAQEGALA